MSSCTSTLDRLTALRSEVHEQVNAAFTAFCMQARAQPVSPQLTRREHALGQQIRYLRKLPAEGFDANGSPAT